MATNQFDGIGQTFNAVGFDIGFLTKRIDKLASEATKLLTQAEFLSLLSSAQLVSGQIYYLSDTKQFYIGTSANTYDNLNQAIDNKVDKMSVSTGTMAYVATNTGDTSLLVSNMPSAGALVQYAPLGQITVPITPISSSDAASKDYVDATVTLAMDSVFLGVYTFGKTTNAPMPAPTAAGQTYYDFLTNDTFLATSALIWAPQGSKTPGAGSRVAIIGKFVDTPLQYPGDAYFDTSWKYYPQLPVEVSDNSLEYKSDGSLGIKIDPAGNNAITLTAAGLKVQIPVVPDRPLAEGTYILSVDSSGTPTWVAINAFEVQP
jgi:hypothetical protein